MDSSQQYYLELIELLSDTIYFIIGGKILLLVIWFASVLLFSKTNKIYFILIGIITIGSISIISELIPTKIGYNLPSTTDRHAYISLAQTYSVCNKFGEDFAYKGYPTFYSPVYPYLISIVHWLTGFDVIRLYDYCSALLLIIFGLSIFYFGCPRDTIKGPNKEEKTYVGLFMAFCVLYLSQDPWKWWVTGSFSYLAFWDTIILLKPSHVLSFVFIPILYFYLWFFRNWKC